MSTKRDFYVYVYSHPDTHFPFYVGKGRGNRARKHLAYVSPERDQQIIIDKLRNQGRKPIIEIVRWGLSEDAAFAVEAALIQQIGLEHLANRQRGHGEPKLHADFMEYIRRDKKPLVVDSRVEKETLILSAKRCYRDGMSRFELYDAVRGNLPVSKERTESCKRVLVLLKGRVIDVYDAPKCIDAGWEPRGFAPKEAVRGFAPNKAVPRSDLAAHFASKVTLNRYVGRRLSVSFSHNPFVYKRIREPQGRF